jgi:hypothetical protein
MSTPPPGRNGPFNPPVEAANGSAGGKIRTRSLALHRHFHGSHPLGPIYGGVVISAGSHRRMGPSPRSSARPVHCVGASRRRTQPSHHRRHGRTSLRIPSACVCQRGVMRRSRPRTHKLVMSAWPRTAAQKQTWQYRRYGPIPEVGRLNNQNGSALREWPTVLCGKPPSCLQTEPAVRTNIRPVGFFAGVPSESQPKTRPHG